MTLRWRTRTAFERPVVPPVNWKCATSSWSTSTGAKVSGEGAASEGEASVEVPAASAAFVSVAEKGTKTGWAGSEVRERAVATSASAAGPAHDGSVTSTRVRPASGAAVRAASRCAGWTMSRCAPASVSWRASAGAGWRGFTRVTAAPVSRAPK